MQGYEEGKYSLVYKCSLCGQVFNAGHTGWLQEEDVEPKMVQELAKNSIQIHECSYFKYGFASLCGFSLDDR